MSQRFKQLSLDSPYPTVISSPSSPSRAENCKKKKSYSYINHTSKPGETRQREHKEARLTMRGDMDSDDERHQHDNGSQPPLHTPRPVSQKLWNISSQHLMPVTYFTMATRSILTH